MKRAPLQRRTVLNRGSYLPKRRKRPRTVRGEDGSRVERVTFGEQAELCRVLPCCVCTRVHDWGFTVANLRCLASRPPAGLPLNEAHHEPPRSRGGTDKDTAPLCRRHHAERHAVGRTEFIARYGVDPHWVARRIHETMEGRDAD